MHTVKVGELHPQTKVEVCRDTGHPPPAFGKVFTREDPGMYEHECMACGKVSIFELDEEREEKERNATLGGPSTRLSVRLRTLIYVFWRKPLGAREALQLPKPMTWTSEKGDGALLCVEPGSSEQAPVPVAHPLPGAYKVTTGDERAEDELGYLRKVVPVMRSLGVQSFGSVSLRNEQEEITNQVSEALLDHLGGPRPKKKTRPVTTLRPVREPKEPKQPNDEPEAP